MKAVQDILGYRFTHENLLREALTHPSLNEQREDDQPLHYQRLEFLGDSILGAVVSDLLYRQYPGEPEGKLAQRKAALVAGSTLAKVMDGLQLAEHIRMSAGEESGGGRDSASIKEDVCEALIGAIYLDGGFEAAYDWVAQIWQPYVEALTAAPQDAKTSLQEWAQGRGLPLPAYNVLSQEGPAHAPVFVVEVQVEGETPQQAEASSKRQAEQRAAAKMLKVVCG